MISFAVVFSQTWRARCIHQNTAKDRDPYFQGAMSCTSNMSRFYCSLDPVTQVLGDQVYKVVENASLPSLEEALEINDGDCLKIHPSIPHLHVHWQICSWQELRTLYCPFADIERRYERVSRWKCAVSQFWHVFKEWLKNKLCHGRLHLNLWKPLTS